jgi:hypothetical protein
MPAQVNNFSGSLRALFLEPATRALARCRLPSSGLQSPKLQGRKIQRSDRKKPLTTMIY